MQKYIALCATNDNQKLICWDKEKDKYYQISMNGGPHSLVGSILGTTIFVQILNHSSFISQLENSHDYVNVNLVLIIAIAFMWGLIRAVNGFKAMKEACGPDTLINVNINDEFLNQIDKDNKLKIFALCGWIPITWLVFQAYISTSNAYNLFICIAAFQTLISFTLTSQIISRPKFLNAKRN